MTELPEAFLRGVALFNAGEFFACHEAWEEIWHTAQGTEREFLHAMIQVAAALHHIQNGNLKGAHSVAERARSKLIAMPAQVMSLDTVGVLQQLDRFFSGDSSYPQLELR